MLRADDLVILLEVARSGTLVAAGAVLGVDHTTVSRRITALEREVGGTVLLRGIGGCQVTDLGRSLLASAESVEKALTTVRMTSRSAGPPEALTGLVRIAAPEAFGACFVAPVIARMHRRFPELTLELVTATRPIVQGNGADIEVGVGDPVSRKVEAFELAKYSLGLYAAPEYLKAHGVPRKPADLRQHSLIYYIDALLRVGDLNVIDSLFPSGGVQLGSTSVFAQLETTKAGGGIGLLPCFLADRSVDLTRVLVTQADIKLKFVASLAPRSLLRPAALAVAAELRQEVATRSAELSGRAAYRTP